MLNQAAPGFLTIVLAGLLQGTVLTPMIYLKKWKWENVWLAYASFAYLLLPWVFALATVHNVFGVLTSAPPAAVIRTIIFGFLWGIAVVLFGLGCEMLGIALGYAIILGLGTSIGALVPLITQHREQLFARAGIGTMAGIALLTAAVVIFSVAGKKRDSALQASGVRQIDRGVRDKGTYVLGLVVCILCGVLNPLYNIAFAYGSAIQEEAIRFGAAPANAGNIVWLIVANAGYFPSLLYVIYLLNKHKSWKFFRDGTRWYWLLTPAMGLMWISGTVLYGVGANLMGPLGPVVGWPMLMSTMVLTATAWGFAGGEWKGVSGFPKRLNTAALAILVAAMFTLGWATRS